MNRCERCDRCVECDKCGTLHAVRFNLETGQTTGSAAPLVTDVAREAGAITGAAQFDVSASGTFVYVPSAPFDSQHVLALAPWPPSGHRIAG